MTYLESLSHARILPSFPTRRSSDLRDSMTKYSHRRVEGLIRTPSMLPRDFESDVHTWKSARLPREQRTLLARSEEHTSEIQSPCKLVCLFLLDMNHKYLYQDIHISR